MKRTFPAGLLVLGGILIGLPAASSAQDTTTAADRVQLTTALPTGCYSNPVSGPSGPTAQAVKLPDIRLTGGPPGETFRLIARDTAAAGVNLGGEGGSIQARFDAAGNATVAKFSVAKYLQPGRARTYKLTLSVEDHRGSDGQYVMGSERELGTVTFAAYSVGIQETDGDAVEQYRQNRPYRVVVSGAPLARKKLYAFLVKGKNTVVKRVALGTSDACGYATGKMVTWPRGKDNVGPRTSRIYVNAGSKFDRARAIATPARAGSYSVGPGSTCRGASC